MYILAPHTPVMVYANGILVPSEDSLQAMVECFYAISDTFAAVGLKFDASFNFNRPVESLAGTVLTDRGGIIPSVVTPLRRAGIKLLTVKDSEYPDSSNVLVFLVRDDTIILLYVDPVFHITFYEGNSFINALLDDELYQSEDIQKDRRVVTINYTSFAKLGDVNGWYLSELLIPKTEAGYDLWYSGELNDCGVMSADQLRLGKNTRIAFDPILEWVIAATKEEESRQVVLTKAQSTNPVIDILKRIVNWFKK